VKYCVAAAPEPSHEARILVVGMRGDHQHARAHAEPLNRPAERGRAALLREE
jgi:hypothetical protein